MDILAGLPPYTLTIVIGLFLLINLLVGLYQGRHLTSLRSYALADKSMGTGTLTITLIATMIGAEYVTVWTIASYEKGVASPVLFSIVYSILILILASTVIPKQLQLKECYTLGDILGKLYGKGAQILTGFITVAVSLVLISAQILAVSNMCGVLELNKTLIILLLGVTITFYTWFGGIRSVAATDIVQFVCLIAGFFFIAYRVFQLDDGQGSSIGSVQRLFELVREEHAETHFNFLTHKRFLGLIMGDITLVLVVFSPPVLNRILAARNVAQVRRSFYGFTLFLPVFMTLLLIIGFGLLFKEGPGSAPIKENIAFAKIADYFFQGNPWIVVLLLVMLLAVVMSTADSFLNSMVVVIIQDIIKPLKKEQKEVNWVKFIPYASLLGGTLAIGLTLMLQEFRVGTLVVLSIMSLGIFATPVLLYGLGLKSSKKVFWTSIAGYFLVESVVAWLAHKNYLFLDDFETWRGLIFRRKMNIVAPLTILITFIISLVAHVVVHKGFVFEKTPSVDTEEEKEISFWVLFRNPVVWATEKITQQGSAPVLLGTFLSLSWMLPELTSPQMNPANFKLFFWIRVLGVTLCTGLLLHNRWKHPYKRYFPLYYYVTLLYGLPFSAGLHFLYNPSNYTTLMFLIVGLVVLMILVDQQIFLLLVGLGFSLALILAWISPFQEAIEGHIYWYAGVSVTYTLMSSFAFMRFKKELMKANMLSHRMWALGFSHDLANLLSLPAETQIAHYHITENAKKITKDGKSYTTLTLPTETFDYMVVDSLKKACDAVFLIKRQNIAFFKIFQGGRMEEEDFEQGSFLGLVEEALEMLTDEQLEGIKVKKEKGKDFEVKLHKEFFSNVLLNLIKNARRHGDADTIEIGCDPVKRELYVKDDGSGIPPHIEPYVFDLYFSTGNTGVGLPFIKQIVETMGGSIRFETSPKGTTFFIHFPPAKK